MELLTKPAASVPEDQRRRVRLISTLVFFFAMTSTIIIFAAGYINSNPRVAVIVIAMWIAYALSRTRHYNLGAYLAVGFPNLVTVLLIVEGTGTTTNSLSVVVLFIILATLLLTMRGAILVMVLNIFALLMMPILAPQHLMVLPTAIIFPSSVLLIVFIVYRDAQERDRQADLRRSLQRSEEANQTLIKANALAKETVRLKSEFMSTMSHELRTPLNAITGFCGIMLEGMGGEIDADAKHMVERVHSNSERLLLLINQVLDLAKIEADRIDLANDPINPKKLAEQWKSQVQVLAVEKGLKFDVRVDPTLPPTIYGDTERLTQVVMNLLSNAFKFTEKGGVELKLRAQSSTWQIEVKDTGIGIPPHALNYIFDEFRQLDGSSTRVYGGSGLGLAIVRKLCVMMGGNVRVSSSLGEGSIFTVTLPLNVKPESEQLAMAEA
jgi:signal transduction histidine kinase